MCMNVLACYFLKHQYNSLALINKNVCVLPLSHTHMQSSWTHHVSGVSFMHIIRAIQEIGIDNLNIWLRRFFIQGNWIASNIIFETECKYYRACVTHALGGSVADYETARVMMIAVIQWSISLRNNKWIEGSGVSRVCLAHYIYICISPLVLSLTGCLFQLVGSCVHREKFLKNFKKFFSRSFFGRICEEQFGVSIFYLNEEHS